MPGRRQGAKGTQGSPLAGHLEGHTMGAYLRLFSGADDAPRSDWRLRRFFAEWYWPQILQEWNDVDRKLSAGTRREYESALTWWEQLTGDPPLAAISRQTLTLFREALKVATYKRGPLGAYRPLSEATRHKVLRTLRAILSRSGPTFDAARPAAEAIAETPRIKVPKVRSRPKPCFSLEQCQKILAAAAGLDRPFPSPAESALRWRVLLAILFYTGRRIGEACRLDWSMVRRDEQVWWLEVPAEITKTHQGERIALHAAVREALEALPSSTGLLFGAPVHARTVWSLHGELQRRAGLQQVFGWHAWRRTHATQMGEAGLASLELIAQAALGHARAATTREHYVDAANKVRLSLPRLW